jgi:4-diphosphocytidyl-2-C-methyl-D-erythritol kinase
MPMREVGLTAPLELRAPAKVNLGLEVTGVRANGFHELRSIIVNVDIADTLRLAPGTGTVVTGDEAPATLVGTDEELASRALRRLEGLAGRDLGVGIRLRKEIPAGAGLGGGSADAAAVLGAARSLGVDVDWEQLQTLALELGADVPFQLVGGAALVGGVGERVEPLPNREHWLSIAFGRFHCSTAEVFAEMGDDERTSGDLVEDAAEAWRRDDGNLLDILETLPNGLWSPATRRYPGVLEDIAGALEGGGWRPRLTGSGSAMYQLCRDQGEAQRLALSASTIGFRAWACRTVPAPSRPPIE